MDFYIVLGGEDSELRPRTKKLIELLKNSQNKNWKEIRIIFTGRSGFKPYTLKTEAKEMKEYFLSQFSAPEKSIVLEEKSFDTLGNMVFTYEIIQKLILQVQDNSVNPKEYPQHTIILVTEKFHMSRAKELFLRLFGTLKGINPNVSFKFESPRIPIFRKIKGKMGKVAKEFAIELTSIYSDIAIYNLQQPEEFKAYLLSLPIYKEAYQNEWPSKRYNLSLSIYAKAIERVLK